jgi:4-hydroxythreonine-4-phosphate dehydrogenase
VIALTCGEPAGIGPEIAASAWAHLRGRVPFFLIGDPGHLPAGVPVAVIETPEAAAGVVACRNRRRRRR